MTKRTIIDPNEPWGMRASLPGRDVLSDGPPYLFDGSLETLQIHQSGFVTDIFQWQYFNTVAVQRCIKAPGADTSFPELVITFPALPYVPHVEWGITSDAVGGAIYFPYSQTNHIGGSQVDTLTSLPVAMIPSTNQFKIIATTGGSDGSYDLFHGGTARQADLYYTVFKRPTT